MKIALLNAKYYPSIGGVENYLRCAALELIARGHVPVVICERSGPDLPAREVMDGVEILRHYREVPRGSTILRPLLRATSGLRSDLDTIRAFLEEALRGVDYVWARHPYYVFAARQVIPSRRVLYIPAAGYARQLQYSHRALPMWKRWLKDTIVLPQVRRLERRVTLDSEHLVALSENMRTELSEDFGVSPEIFSVVPPGVDLSRFSVRDRDTELLAEFGIRPEHHVVLTVCRLSPEKNVTLLIDALRHIDRGDVALLIVGDGPQRSQIERLARGDPRVKLAGPRRDTWRFYSTAHVFALPSSYEPFGNVLLEAMACGCPCIALSPGKGIRTASAEIIHDGQTGRLVPSTDPEAFVSTLAEMLGDEKARAEMGRRAREICEEGYRWETTVGELLAISARMAGSPIASPAAGRPSVHGNVSRTRR